MADKDSKEPLKITIPQPKEEEPSFNCLGNRIPFKYASLVALVVQNSALIIVVRLSRTESGPLYIAGTAVVMSELIKLICSILLIYREEGSVSKTIATLNENIVQQPGTTALLLIPAGLYTLQGNLLFLAGTYLDVATFQVLYQLKILTAALFSVILLGKNLNLLKWFSLLLLSLGVAAVQLSSEKGGSGKETDMAGKTIGLIMVSIAVFSSGFAGVFFEKMLKGYKANIWVRNVQLGLFGTLLGLVGLYMSDGELVMEKGFFYGYTNTTVSAIMIQAVGGLIVALVMKYADNILKGFATSFSILLSCFVAVVFMDFLLTPLFGVGAMLVIISVILYSRD